VHPAATGPSLWMAGNGYTCSFSGRTIYEINWKLITAVELFSNASFLFGIINSSQKRCLIRQMYKSKKIP
jgi:hypothetical protein